MKTKVLVLGLMMAAAATAQSSNGYLYFAPGGLSSHGNTAMTLQAGAGADILIAKGIGANVEVGAVWPRECFGECVVGVFSPGGTYYFRRGKEHRLDPFVNGGYTLMFREGHGNLFYFGGGADYWMTRRVGLRMEFRDHVSTAYTTAHFWGFRLGLAFR